MADDPSGPSDVCDALDLIASLVDKSLLKEESGPGGESRLLMLETIREYGLERLHESGEETEMRRRHALLMTELAEQAEPYMTSAARDPWMARLDADLDNIRAALAWSLSERGDPQVGLRLAGALGWYWYFRGYFVEGRGWLEKFIAEGAEAQSPQARAKVLHVASVIASAQGDRDVPRGWVADAVEIWRLTGDGEDLPLALTLLGILTVVGGDVESGCSIIEGGLEQLRYSSNDWRLAVGLERLGDALLFWRKDSVGAAKPFQESLELFKRAGDLHGEALGYRNVGEMALCAGRYDEAHRSFECGVAVATRAGDKLLRALMIVNLGMAEFLKTDYARASARFETALSHYKVLGARRYRMQISRCLGYVAIQQRNYQHAAELYDDYLSMVRMEPTEIDLVLSLNAIANLAAHTGQARPAVELSAFASSHQQAVSFSLCALDAFHVNQTLRLARQALFAENWEQLSRSGETMQSEEALSIARTVVRNALQTASTLATELTRTPSAVHRTNPHGLSKREIELLGLLAVGLSNAEIAAKLFLSPNTVRAHLYSIYSKIDVTSRTAAAHYAHEHYIA
jgi:DNA-binding CsgD family transcriptional regulator/tetratricopeptide (TPR) repeat protein